MDDYGGTFFDNLTSSSYYSSSTTFPSDMGTLSAQTSNTKIDNSYLQEVNDLDSLLLPSSDNDSLSHDSLQVFAPKQEPESTVSLTKASSKSVKFEAFDSNSFFSNSIDNLLESRNPTVVNAGISNQKIKIETGFVKKEPQASLNVPRIIRLDGTTQTLSAGSKIQIHGMHTGQKLIRVCVASKSNLVHLAKSTHKSNLFQNPVSLNSTNQSLNEHPVKITNTVSPTSPPNVKDLENPNHLRILVSNVVSSFRLGCHLSLRRIALDGMDVVYKKESQKVVMRLRKPKCTAYMWSSGKVVCTGSNSSDAAYRASRKIARRLQKMGFKVRFSEFKVVNVLAVSKMPYAINITEFSQAYRGKHCSYEPELHPGVTFRIPDLKATLKIFSTGSVTVTARSVQRAKDAIKQVYPSFKPFYKTSKPNYDINCEDALPSDTEDLS